jgi:hypothetical protein
VVEELTLDNRVPKDALFRNFKRLEGLGQR